MLRRLRPRQRPGGVSTLTGHRIDNFGTALRQTAPVDIDRDGDLDWVARNAAHARERPGEIFHENLGRGLAWREHRTLELSEAHRYGISVRTWTSDFDGDGDVDDHAGSGPLSASKKFACYIWENTSRGHTWTEHVLLVGKQCHEVEAGDVDGDRDIDLCTKPWKDGNEHLFFRNRLKDSAR